MNSTIECDICESAVQLVKDDMGMANVTVAALGLIVKAMCAHFATRVGNKECDVIVDSIQKIVSLAKRGYDNLHICQSIKLC